ncbi:MAG: patatin-like phospholipase family protein [Thioalkalivibrio sp.]|nr:patatin-like phospholipase family protein [Thioalkalivibrio sp.]
MKALSLLLLLPLALFPSVSPASGEVDPPSRPSVGLALGSGGAGGLAHIAILQVFDAAGKPPDQITGSSIGAVIGGLYAAGLGADAILDIFDDFAGSELDALTGLAQSEIRLLDVVPLRAERKALFEAGPFLRFLAKHTEARDFADLEIPFAVVATDFRTGDSVVIDEGDLFRAIEASMAVPGLFEPVEYQGHPFLIDGGASNPLPYNLLDDSHDYIVAVDVTGNGTPNETVDIGIADVLFTSFSIMQGSIVRHMTRLDPPDLYLAPDIGNIRLLHFNRIAEVLRSAQPSADKLRSQLEAWGAYRTAPSARE